MNDKTHFKINHRIVAVMLILFTIACIVVCGLNIHNLGKIYEKFFTERAIITNSLIAAELDGDEVKEYVDLICAQDDAFKERQLQFYYDRKELLKLQAEKASEEEQGALLERLEAFSREMFMLKTNDYWKMIDKFIALRDASDSKYVYLFADTGLVDEDGKTLYTFIFDAEDKEAYDSIENDGLGTVYDGEDIIADIYITKKPLKTIIYYNDEPYGECYFAYAPVLDSGGNVVAILGADLELGAMNKEIAASTALFSVVFLAFIIIMIAFIYIFISRNVTNPLIGLTATAQKLSEGDIYAAVPAAALKARNEIGMLALAINDMGSTYQSMIKNTGELFEAASIGKLNIRNDASNYKGSIREVMEQINDTLDAMTLYLNSIPESILIMNKNFETHFRNEKYTEVFGELSAAEFVEKALECEKDNKAVWIAGRCFSVIFKEIHFNESYENSIIMIAIDITELMNEKENANIAAKAKSDFLSRMSHEMRTPMNAIIGMTKIADSTDDISKLKYCLSTIAVSSGQLLGIINDVLDMSKIEAGKFELDNTPMNVEKLLMKVCNLVSDKVESKGQKLHVVMDKSMTLNYIGDELRLSQVLTNLLSNSVKFTPEGGMITLSVDEIVRNKDASTLRFAVSDTGIGITKEQISRLFTSFEQADGSITRRFGGTGLGLAISKSIVEKMGGSITAESEYGHGATFSFEVTLEVDRMPKTPEIKADSTNEVPDFSGIRILLAEDVEINREILITLLEDTQVTIDIAENGIEAIEKFKATPDIYDMIFMDIQMPEMDGYEATRTIRALNIPVAKAVPIIAMTANAFKEDVERCLECGMNDHLSKPIDEKAVINKIKHYVQKFAGSTDYSPQR